MRGTVPKTILELGGKTVEIEETALPGSRPGKHLRATVGETIVELAVTFGAEDGPRPDVTVEQLQSDLDAARQRVASEAVWREDLRVKLEQIK